MWPITAFRKYWLTENGHTYCRDTQMKNFLIVAKLIIFGLAKSAAFNLLSKYAWVKEFFPLFVEYCNSWIFGLFFENMHEWIPHYWNPQEPKIGCTIIRNYSPEVWWFQLRTRPKILILKAYLVTILLTYIVSWTMNSVDHNTSVG